MEKQYTEEEIKKLIEQIDRKEFNKRLRQEMDPFIRDWIRKHPDKQKSHRVYLTSGM